ncbi:MAG: succinate dehydrogenase [Dehalococcoidia bacterium]|nr:succinate dehydrogenase [Dehalococcoidia bacterium]MCA9826638.1 succinate dehydrogenase [Dehalococcoidia bacterium]MCA9846028.1 succinate dehydrogenase [Dehalococcoidia bacterium]MCA9852876.1 succinate dehydrogenase [Dehalococcoidia bacterium]
MAQAVASPHRRGFRSTLRTDAWWFEPVLVFISLSVFFGWLTVSIFLDQWAFEIGPYLSPIYEPKFFEAHGNILISPALIVLIGPVPFRATCYYYRRAYYRSYFLSPPACAVGDVAPSYKGESRFPLIIQNVHRFAMYMALVFIPILWIGAVKGFHDADEGWGIGLGSIFLVVNAYLLMMYTVGCHSLRHFSGGSLNTFSASAWTRLRKRIWDRVSLWNGQHRFWAWTSLIWIVATDLYIRLVANDIITDPNTWDHF